MDMASNLGGNLNNGFNLNQFLQEYKTYGDRQYFATENGKAAMEQRDIQRAQEAVTEKGLLSLTLSEKLAELGIGDRVFQQIGDSALGLLKDIVDPITDYFEKYDNIFNQDVYNSEIQAYAKQMYFAREALAEDAASRANGQKFVLDM